MNKEQNEAAQELLNRTLDRDKISVERYELKAKLDELEKRYERASILLDIAQHRWANAVKGYYFRQDATKTRQTDEKYVCAKCFKTMSCPYHTTHSGHSLMVVGGDEKKVCAECGAELVCRHSAEVQTCQHEGQ
jgi:hypothetical protein